MLAVPNLGARHDGVRRHLILTTLAAAGGATPCGQASARRMGSVHTAWRFGTGRPSDIDRLSYSLRLFRPGSGPKKLEDHSTALWLIDHQGQIRNRYPSHPPDVDRLAREIQALDRVTRAAPA